MTFSSGMTRHRLSRRSGVASGGSPVHEFVEIARMDIPSEKLRVVQNLVMQGDVGLDAVDPVLAESDTHTVDGFLTGTAIGNDFGQQGVVIHRHHAVLANPGFNADPHPPWGMIATNRARRGQHRHRILSNNPTFQGMTGEGHVSLTPRQRLSGGGTNASLNDIDAGHHFRNRMFDLHPGVHLDEIKAPLRIEEKLDSTNISVSHCARSLYRGCPHAVAQSFVQGWRRCLFHDFLVPSLYRAFAFAQVEHVAMLVSDNLKLDMT